MHYSYHGCSLLILFIKFNSLSFYFSLFSLIVYYFGVYLSFVFRPIFV